MEGDTFFKMRITPESMETMVTRDHRGSRITIDWGRPDAEGFYNPTFTVNATDNVVLQVLQALERRIEHLKAPVLGKKGVVLKDDVDNMINQALGQYEYRPVSH